MSVAWFDGATLTVEIAFTTDPQDPSPSWTDVSAYVRDISVSCGRSSEFSAISPSTLSVTFDNRDRRFDPEHASGPYFGDLNPMKKIRVRWAYSAVTYDRFTGYVQGWPQQYVNKFDSTVTVQAVDGSRFLEQAVLPASAYAGLVVADGADHYWPMQEQNTSAASAYVDFVGGRDLFMAAEGALVSTDLGVPIGQSQGVTATVETSSILTTLHLADYLDNEPRTLEFWYRKGVPVDPVTFGDLTPDVLLVHNTGTFLGISHNNGFVLADFSSSALNKKLANDLAATAPSTGELVHIAMSVTDTTAALYINGLSVDSDTLAATAASYSAVRGLYLSLVVNESNPESISHLAIYPDALTASQVSAHYDAGVTAFGHPYGERSGARFDRILDDAGWPSAARDLSTGDTVHGVYRPEGQSAMSMLRDVEVAEDGYFFIDGAGDVVLRDRTWQWTQTVAATFSDDGSDIPYRDITIDANTVDAIYNKVSATYGASGGYVFTEDTASRDAYGPATQALSVPTVDDSTIARGLTEYKLRTMKDPQSRITSIVVRPRANAAAAFPAILGLQIGDRVQVEITPVNVGSQVVKELTVQGINERVTVSGEWDTTLYLSPAPSTATDVPYLTLGDATYGRIGAAAGNKIPF